MGKKAYYGVYFPGKEKGKRAINKKFNGRNYHLEVLEPNKPMANKFKRRIKKIAGKHYKIIIRKRIIRW